MTDLENQITDDYTGRRYYEWPDGQYWSATTILNGGIPRYGLIEWAAKVAAEKAVAMAESGQLAELLLERGADAAIRAIRAGKEERRDDAADVGKWLHRVAQAWGEGRDTPRVPTSIARHVEQLRRWFDKAQPRIVAVEAIVYHRGPDGFRYAGQVDLIAWIRNEQGVEELWLIDLKTGERIYPEAVIQLASYGRATFIADRDGETELPMPAVDRYGILHVRPTFAKLKPARVDEDCWLVFRHAAGVHTWGTELNRGRLDKPVGYPLHEDATWTETAKAATAEAASQPGAPSSRPSDERPGAQAPTPPSAPSGISPGSQSGTPTPGTTSGSRRRSSASRTASSPSRRRHNRRDERGRFAPGKAA